MKYVNVLDSFILVITLNTSKFTSFVLFGVHILQDGSSTELQLPSYLSKLQEIDSEGLLNYVYQDSSQ